MSKYMIACADRTEGIMTACWNEETFELTAFKQIGGSSPASYVALGRDGKTLYTIAEDGYEALGFDPKTGEGWVINKALHPSGAAYISLTQKGDKLLVAGYGNGTVVTFDIRPDGGLADKPTEYLLTGSSVNPVRQEGPHPHCILSDAQDQRVVVSDLGADKVRLYALEAGALSLLNTVDTPSGSGPRHLAFHPAGRYLYVLTELSGQVLVYEMDAECRKLTERQRIFATPNGYVGFNFGGDIRISADGKWLYTSNRGQNSIAMFSIQSDTGLLALRSINKMRGAARNFRLVAGGKYIFCMDEDINGTRSALEVLKPDTVNGKIDLVPTYAPMRNGFCLDVVE